MAIERRWLTVVETAKYLGLHPETISSLCLRGALPSVLIRKPGKKSGSRRIDKKKLDQLLEAKTELDPYEAERLMERMR